MKSKYKKVKRFNKIIDKAILQILIEFDHTCTVRSHIVCVCGYVCVHVRLSTLGVNGRIIKTVV